ncbi:MAG TPA: hypothetical protein VHH52_00695 [Pseudonocardiaceae bacterium]|nr:hypothetical protein [Pseudonocardiaceae bacterium]
MAANEPDADTFVTTALRSTRPVGGADGSLPHATPAPSTATNPSAAKIRAVWDRAGACGVGLVGIVVTARFPPVIGFFAVQRLTTL